MDCWKALLSHRKATTTGGESIDPVFFSRTLEEGLDIFRLTPESTHCSDCVHSVRRISGRRYFRWLDRAEDATALDGMVEGVLSSYGQVGQEDCDEDFWWDPYFRDRPTHSSEAPLDAESMEYRSGVSLLRMQRV